MKKTLKQELEEVVKEFDGVLADNISYLIQSRAGYYIVYLDIENDLDWFLTDEGENQLDQEKYSPFLARINFMQYKPCVIQMSKKMQRQYKCILGNALILAIENKYEEAEECIKEAQEYIEEREYEITRKWNAEFCLLVFIITSILYFIGEKWIFLENYQEYFNFLWYGSIGVLLSILQHNAYINAKCTAGRGLLVCEIISKFIVGMISALIVIEAFKSGIFMTEFVNSEHEREFIVLIGIVAGFSERLAPSLIGKIEGKEGSTNEEKNSDNL